MTQIGALDKYIAIQRPTQVSDSMGGFTESWATAASVWGAIWPVSASEKTKANAPSIDVTHRVRIRYRSVLKGNWRVLYNGRYFSIVSIIDPNEAHEWLDLLCKEVKS